MRRGARAAFALSALLGLGLALVVVQATLTSHRAPFTGDVAIAQLSTLQDGKPAKLVVSLLGGLDQKARQQRGASNVFGVIHVTPTSGLPVYVVRDGDDVRVFIAIDPRNGCDLEVLPNPYAWPIGASVFHDVCHGSLYDLHGNIVGGPAYWSLDQLAVAVRNGRVEVHGGTVIPGHVRPSS